MPINTDLNTPPYYDDYNANNEYYRILFRPATAVQARELTQTQSILQNQIENFGNWAFKSGDLVSGCAIHDDPNVDFVRLQDFQTNTASFSIASFANLQVVSQTSNLTATILYANSGLVSQYPNTNVIYVNYVNTGNNGAKVFSNNESLIFYTNPRTGNNTADTVAIVNTYANSTSGQTAVGLAHGIHVDAGVVYLNGVFVNVLQPTYGIVNNFGTYAGNNVVGFTLSESIVTENQDTALLDNALGYSNENAPGAHRLKLLPTLVSLDPTTSSNTKGFNPIVSYNYGSLITQTIVSKNVYSIIGDVMAKRTYEESGNYVVNPFVVDSVTSGPISLSSNQVFGRINPGVGYAQGYRVELQKAAYINMRRGVDTDNNAEQQITFNYGGYFLLNEVAGDFDFTKAANVTLYDTAQQAVTNRTWNSLSPTGTAIGTASLKCFTYNNGSIGSNTAQYNLHIFNVVMGSGYNVSQIKSVYYNGTVKGVGDLVKTGLQSSSIKDQLYTFGTSGLLNLRDTSNNINTQYTYRNKTSTTMNTSGDLTITITSSAPGGTDILPYGIGQLADSSALSFNLIATANVDSAALTGTVNVTSTGTTVLGNATSFLTNFNPYDTIKVGSDKRTIVSITNSTSLTVDSAFSSTATTQTYYKTYVSGKIIPISTASVTGPTSYVNVTNTTSFTINTAEVPASSLTVDVVYDILRTSTTPAAKVINKNRFVKLNTLTNPNGPWCLGYNDVHQIRAIYGSSTATYLTTDNDVTANFVLDTGQKDTYYDLAYLYPVSGYNSSKTPYLLVELDYFSANTSAGVNFYTVESYPINDGLPGFVTISSSNTTVFGTDTTFNTSFNIGDLIQVNDTFRTVNTVSNSTYMTVNNPFNNSLVNVSYYNATSIQTKDMPLYIDDSGKKIPLRDYVDFRVNSTITATDTGKCDTSNTSQLTAAIAAATVNPSTTLTFSIPTNGLNVPSYGRNLQSDYTYYLGRKDLVLITPDNIIKVKEGLSSLSPQHPLYPDNAMAVAIIDIPPYPSLSSDQRDSLLSINQRSKNLTRDTTLAITVTPVTNRRYTMKDIGKIDSRVTNLEYYTALTLLEKKATDMTVTDANGLNRFKNGIFVDPFNDFTQSDVSNPEYSLAIDTNKGHARPRIVREVVKVEFNNSTSSNVQKTGRVISLPYTEVACIVQPFATKYRSSAHVSHAWNGTCVLIPSYDNHTDTNNTGSISITVDLTTPWNEFAQSPFGSIWGDWVTTTSVTSNTVTTNNGGFIPVVDLGHIGTFTGGGQEKRAAETALAIIHSRFGNNVTIGSLSIRHE